MCLVETKTYRHPNGQVETFENTRYCTRAVGNRRCSRVERRIIQSARLEERRPVQDFGSDSYLITQGQAGRERVYREVTRHPTRRVSIRQTNVTAGRPRVDPMPPASPSYVEVMPEAPMPPRPSTGFPMPYPSYPSYPEDPMRTELPDGTAVYNRPLSSGVPRANDGRHRTRDVRPEDNNRRRQSFSSTAAEYDEPVTPSAPPRPRTRRPSIHVNNTAAAAYSSSPSTSSPGLSQLPNVNLRRDSLGDAEYERDERLRQRIEDERDAQRERDRIAESERRQQARRNAEKMARDASRERKERYRREAAAALEGQRAANESNYELAQADREQQRYQANDRLRQEADARRLADDRHPPYQHPPTSVRPPVQVRQYPSGYRTSGIQQGGEEVINRERNRARRSSRTQRDQYDYDSGYER
jgi:hypothetical protein